MESQNWEILNPSTPRQQKKDNTDADNTGSGSRGYKLKTIDRGDLNSTGLRRTTAGITLNEPHLETPLQSVSAYASQPNSAAKQTIFPNCQKAYVVPRNMNCTDIIELQRSMFAVIEKYHDAYVCIHDIMEYVSKRVVNVGGRITWKHVDERTFLFVLPDETTKEKFAATYKMAFFGDAMVKFTPWKPSTGRLLKPPTLKVWLKLTGLSIEHYCFNTAEVVVSGFGRLHRCNMEKKKTFIGAFFCMVNCHSLDDIEKCVLLETENGAEIPVFIKSEYACTLDDYNAEKFDDNLAAYDDIISSLIERQKMKGL